MRPHTKRIKEGLGERTPSGRNPAWDGQGKLSSGLQAGKTANCHAPRTQAQGSSTSAKLTLMGTPASGKKKAEIIEISSDPSDDGGRATRDEDDGATDSEHEMHETSQLGRSTKMVCSVTSQIVH